jgi:hypothetical protein
MPSKFFNYEELQKLLIQFKNIHFLRLSQAGRNKTFALFTSSSRNRKRASCSVSGTTTWTPCSHSWNLPGTSGLFAPHPVRLRLAFPVLSGTFGWAAWHFIFFPAFFIFPVTSESSWHIPVTYHFRFASHFFSLNFRPFLTLFVVPKKFRFS